MTAFFAVIEAAIGIEMETLCATIGYLTLVGIVAVAVTTRNRMAAVAACYLLAWEVMERLLILNDAYFSSPYIILGVCIDYGLLCYLKEAPFRAPMAAVAAWFSMLYGTICLTEQYVGDSSFKYLYSVVMVVTGLIIAVEGGNDATRGYRSGTISISSRWRIDNPRSDSMHEHYKAKAGK